MDMYRIIHPIKAEYAFFLSTWDIYKDRWLTRLQIIPDTSKINMKTTFSEKNTMTVEANYKKIV